MTLGPQFERFYHGTNLSNVESIMEHGLKQHDPSEWLKQSGQIPEDDEDYGHPKGVYLGDRETAEAYGEAIFSVDLPTRHPNWGWTESEGAVWQGDIPSVFLTREK